MHYDKFLFIDYHSLKHRLYVGGIGSGLKAVGVGDIEIKDPNGNVRILKGVLHVPKLKCGLMSLNSLTLSGWKSVIIKDGCTVSDGDFKIHSPIRNGLCVWSQGENVNALVANTAKKLSLTDLHERLGHVVVVKAGVRAGCILWLKSIKCIARHLRSFKQAVFYLVSIYLPVSNAHFAQ